MSICSIEDLAEAGVEPFWFQLYVMRDREFMKDLIRRAKEAKMFSFNGNCRPTSTW